MVPDHFQFLAWVATVLVLGRALPVLMAWARRADAEAWRVMVLGTLALAGLRWFNTAALAGVPLHFLGATIATLMFGPWRACWVMAVASVAGVWLGAGWQGVAVDFLLTGALPIAVSVLIGYLAQQFLPANIFTYTLIHAFGAAAMAMAVSMLARAAVAALFTGARGHEWLLATPLLMFAEAFFSGAVMVLVVVYRPRWCASFDDRVYLWPKRPM